MKNRIKSFLLASNLAEVFAARLDAGEVSTGVSGAVNQHSVRSAMVSEDCTIRAKDSRAYNLAAVLFAQFGAEYSETYSGSLKTSRLVSDAAEVAREILRAEFPALTWEAPKVSRRTVRADESFAGVDFGI